LTELAKFLTVARQIDGRFARGKINQDEFEERKRTLTA
jgi:uncharacterized membrane protein